MRSYWIHKNQQRVQLFTGNASIGVEIVDKAHHSGDCSIELHPLKVLANLLDASVHSGSHFFSNALTFCQHILQTPYALQEPAAAFNSGCTPRDSLIKCSNEHLIGSDRICAILID